MLSPSCRTSEQDVHVLPRAPEVQSRVPHETATINGLEAGKSAALERRNPRSSQRQHLKPAGCMRPALKTVLLAVCSSGGRGELPSGGAANDADGEDAWVTHP
jgi:hypothetical protein